MLRYRIAPQAIEDMREIWAYIAHDNPTAADKMLDSFDDAFEMLRSLPDSGRIRDELLPGIRSYPVGNYLIFYRHWPDWLEIYRIIHGNKDLDNEF